MKNSFYTCDKCKAVFEPKIGVGELKLTYCDSANPLQTAEGIKANVKSIRYPQLCRTCSDKYFSMMGDDDVVEENFDKKKPVKNDYTYTGEAIDPNDYLKFNTDDREEKH